MNPVESMPAQTVAMTSDGSISWQAVPVESAGGTLYTAPDCPSAVGQVVLSYAGENQANQNRVGSGASGSVYREEDMAIKVFNNIPLWRGIVNGDLNVLRANYGFKVGLDRTRQHISDDSTGRGVSYSAPAIQAAFVRHNQPGHPVQAVWAMDFIKGVRPHETEVPAEELRLVDYYKALGACGLSPKDVYLDDGLDNMLLQFIADRKHIVKFDIGAARRLDF